MTRKVQKSAKVAALIRKTAQKLVNNPKHLQKLALTLPLLALFVEEVRAAQGKPTQFEDLQALTDFVEAQELDEQEYADIEASLEDSLEGLQLAANDQAPTPEENDDDKGLLLKEEGSAGPARGFSGEAASDNAAVVGEHAAAENESFELAGLVIPVAPGAFAAGIAGALGVVAAVTNTATAAPTGALVVSTPSQLADVLAGSTAGVQTIRIDLSNQDLLNELVQQLNNPNSSLSANLATALASGIAVSIDMGSAATLSDAQAAVLIRNGLSFAATDAITLEVDQQGALLSTTLKELQKLGVDAISPVGGVTAISVNFDSASNPSSTFSTTALPVFADGLNVTLNIDSSQAAQITSGGYAAALSSTAHIDQLHINLIDAQAASTVGAGYADELSALLGTSGLNTLSAASLNPVIDIGGSSINAALGITESQASTLIADGLHFASADSITLQADAGSTHLSTSLKDLQKLGVDAVAVSGTQHISVDLGGLTAAEVTAGSPIAHFASAAGTLDVTLNVQDATQFDQATQMASSLATAGIGNVEINVAADANGYYGAALGALNANNDFRDDIATLVNSGFNVGLDFGGKDVVANVVFDELSTINLANEGLHLAANDHIGLAIHAADPAGTHLANSLKDLQKLGVDTVTVSGTDHVVVDSGGLTAADIGHGVALTQFESDLNVTLSVADLNEFHATSAIATQLSEAHIDNIEIVVPGTTPQEFSANFNTILEAPQFSNDLTTFTNAHLNVGFDFGGADNAVNVTFDALSAAIFAADGLHFAANDIVDLQVHAAQGTHLSASLQDLQKLGVDNVLVDAGIHSVSVDFAQGQPIGNQTILVGDINKDGRISTDEDAALDVTVNVHNLNDLSVVTSLAENFALAGVDHLGLLASDFNDATLVDFLEKMTQAGGKLDYSLKVDTLGSDGGITQDLINFGFDSNATPGRDWGDFIQTMQDTGMANIEFNNSANTRLGIDDELSAALYESGMLHALPRANIYLDASINPVFGGGDPASSTHQALNTSLKAMADLGVDQVVSASSVNKLYVELGDHADVATIIAGFTEGSQAPTHGGLFGTGKEAGLVVDDTTFAAFSHFTPADLSNLLGKLSSLGFTEIDVLKGETDTEAYRIEVVAQTPVLSSTAQILGVNDAQALLDVFGTDIHDKKIS